MCEALRDHHCARFLPGLKNQEHRFDGPGTWQSLSLKFKGWAGTKRSTQKEGMDWLRAITLAVVFSVPPRQTASLRGRGHSEN